MAHEAQRSPTSAKLPHLRYRIFVFVSRYHTVIAGVRSCRKHLVALSLAEDITVLLEWAADELGLLPQVGSEESVGVRDGHEGSLEGVLKSLGGTGRGSVDVVNTGELEQTLDSWRCDQASTTRSGDELQDVSELWV